MFSQKVHHLDMVAVAEEACRQRGLPLTVQRRAIIANLAGRTDHPTADDVFDSVRHTYEGISRATVYRVLDTFVTLGLVRKIFSPEPKARFDADTGRHHHLFCTQCGRVSDLHDTGLNSLPIPDAQPPGWIIEDYSLNFTGRCNLCSMPDPVTAV